MRKKTLLILFLVVLAMGSALQAQSVLTGYYENFNHKLSVADSAFWAPSAKMFATDTLVFTVTQGEVTPSDSALHITEIQQDFADGQMYDFLGAKNSLLNLTDNPYLSFKVKIDSADWRAPDWGQGGIAVPQTSVPFGLSVWTGETRTAGSTLNVPIDGQWHEYFISFVTDPQVDLSAISKLLVESVTWNLGSQNVHNKCYYWIDDFKAGDQASVNAVTNIAITGAADISVNGTALNLGVDITPADATIPGVIWKTAYGTGNGSVDANGKFTPIADGTMKVIALATDGSGVSDTVTIAMSNQTDVVKTFSENFTNPDLRLWAASGQPYSGDTLAFTVTKYGDSLSVMERQSSFSDGQMYEFKNRAGKLLNLTENPFVTFKLKLDSADWRAPDWGQGGKAVPQTTVPFALSLWDDTHADRIAGSSVNLPIDGQWHTYLMTFVADPALDLSAISKILVESVTWNLGSENVHNKAYYLMDDFKAGIAAIPANQAAGFTIAGKDGVSEITVKGTTLQMVGTFDPIDATLQDVIWKVVPGGTGYAKIDPVSGILTPISDGTVKVVGLTMDGSALSDSTVITLSNQIVVKFGYTQNFNSAPNVDLNLWQPNTAPFGVDTMEFAVSTTLITGSNYALQVAERQSSFADGQLFDFKSKAGFVLNITDNPLASFDIKIDSADWRAPDWGQGGLAVPQTTVPMQLSCYNGDAHFDAYSYNVPIDGMWHTYYYTFMNPSQDLTAVDKMLLESVTWNLTPNVHNTVYYLMDNFMVGNTVSVPYPVETITVSNTMGMDSIQDINGTLGLKAKVTPDTATISAVYWTSSDTLIANVSQGGKVTAKDVQGDVDITAAAKDGSGITGTMTVHVSFVTGIHSNTISQFKLYPNPASDYIKIAGADRISSVTVSTLTGQVVLVENLNGSRNQINISSLNKGLYMMKIIDKTGASFVRNFVKQ